MYHIKESVYAKSNELIQFISIETQLREDVSERLCLIEVLGDFTKTLPKGCRPGKLRFSHTPEGLILTWDYAQERNARIMRTFVEVQFVQPIEEVQVNDEESDPVSDVIGEPEIE